MKKTAPLLSIALTATAAFAQPTIQSGMKLVANGSSFSAASANAGSVSPGNGGNNATWDFTTLPVSPLGTITYVDPKTTPFISTFQTANYGLTLVGRYSYFKVSSDKMEVMAYTILKPGAGENDYSPNPRTLMTFPMAFGASVTDTWQKAGASSNTVTITYDGYGTLKTPNKTYSNVVRIKESYNDGVDYQWYSLDPLMNLGTYSHGSNTFYFLDAASNGLEENTSEMKGLTLYPNPSNGIVKLNRVLEGSTEVSFVNALGAVVNQVTLNNAEQAIDLSGLSDGIYFYQVKNNGQMVKSGKIQLNR